MPSICSRLEKWLQSRRLNYSCGPSSTLSKILDTPATGSEAIQNVGFNSSEFRTTERVELSNSQLHTIKTGENRSLINEILIENDTDLEKDDMMLLDQNGQGSEDIEAAVRKLSLISTSCSVDGDYLSPFSALLAICGQSAPSTLQEVFSRYSSVPYFLVTCYLGLWETMVSISVCFERPCFYILYYPLLWL